MPESFASVTGESTQHIKMRRHSPTPSLLRTVDPDQQQLEAAVFMALTASGDRAAHPLRIRRVRLRDGHPPIIFLDSHTGSGLVSRFFVSTLPVLTPEGLAGALPGVRILQINRRDLYLGLAHTSARLVLRGAQGTNWLGDLRAFRRQLNSQDRIQWNSTMLDAEEIYGLSRHPANLSHNLLGSRLLRRAALFASRSDAHLTYTYNAGKGGIKVWMELAPTVPIDHRPLTAALLDPEWGLDMRVQHLACYCGLLERQGCTVRLAPAQEPKYGQLTLMFVHLDPGDNRMHDYFRGVGADSAWIERALPASDFSDDV